MLNILKPNLLIVRKVKIATAVLIFLLAINLIYQKSNVQVTLSVKNIEEIHKNNINEVILTSSDQWIITRTKSSIDDQNDRNANMVTLTVNKDVTILSKNGINENIDMDQQFENNNDDENSDPKNQAYLFAIKNDAEFIYDCEEYPKFDLTDYFIYDMNDYGLVYDYGVKSRRVINPLAHFGQPLLAQRGNPFGDEIHINSYFVGKRKTSAVQHRPLDVINPPNSIIRFDETAPNFQLPIGKMGVFNSKATLYRYQAFWALYLPSTAPQGYADIWRSFWAQRLMWLTNETLSFVGPGNTLIEDVESKTTQNLDDTIRYLIDFLYKWTCQKASFYDCIIDLSLDMAKNGFWETEEVNRIENWLNNLFLVGYKLPKMVNFDNNTSNMENVYNDVKSFSKVRYTPKIQSQYKSKQFRNASIEDTMKKLETYLVLNDFCRQSNYTIGNLSQFISNPYKYKANYTLLITFNLRIFEKNIPLILNLLDSYFQNIIFCGNNITNVLNETRGLDQERFDSYTFIDYNSLNGYFHYYCMNKAIEMNYYKTQGILLASDDVLIKPWNLRNLDETKIWYFEALRPKLELKLTIDFNWMWWGGNAPKLMKLFNYTRDVISGDISASESLTPKEIYFIKEFISNLDRHRIDKLYISYGGSDIFYIPKRKFDIFHYIADVFQTHGIFLEIAVPTILNGINGERDAIIMNGAYRWGSTFSIDEYDKAETFAHPFKMSGLRGNDVGTKYCKFYIQDKINRNI